MTGVRLARCDCCFPLADDCGFTGATGLPCSTPTSSLCPSTLAVTVSFGGADMYVDCNDGTAPLDCQIINPIPSISSTAVTVTQSGTNNCIYSGSASISGSWDSDPCTGAATTYTWTSIGVELKGHSHTLTNAQLVSPCTGEGCSGTRCAGICAQITLNYSYGTGSTGAYELSACWFHECLADCGDAVPCYNSYANRVPDQKSTFLTECTSSNDDSACGTGNGWSKNCSLGGRFDGDASFTVTIS